MDSGTVTVRSGKDTELKVELAPEGTTPPPPPGEAGSVSYTITDKETGEDVDSAKTTVAGQSDEGLSLIHI